MKTSQYFFELNSGGVIAMQPLLYSCCWIYSSLLAVQTTHSFISFTLLFLFFSPSSRRKCGFSIKIPCKTIFFFN